MKVLFTVSSAAARLHGKKDEALMFNREQWSDNQERGKWLSHVASRALKKDHNGIVKTLGARASNISLLLGVKIYHPYRLITQFRGSHRGNSNRQCRCIIAADKVFRTRKIKTFLPSLKSSF